MKYAIIYSIGLLFTKTPFFLFYRSKMILKENVSEYQPKLIKKITLTLCCILTFFVGGVEVTEINWPGKNLLQ